MNFLLECPSVTSANALDPEDQTLGEAMENVFGLGDFVVLWWNDFPIKISLKYDLSQMVRDIFQIFECMEREEVSFTIHWPSSSFFAQWDFTSLEGETLQVEAHWMAITGGNDELAGLRNAGEVIKVDRNYFLGQWAGVLKLVRETLTQQGYQVGTANHRESVWLL